MKNKNNEGRGQSVAMEHVYHLPRKIFRISDLTFTLPDDFEGDVVNAIELVVEYLRSKPEFNHLSDNDKSTIESLFQNIKNNAESKICMQYGIFECNDEGDYILK